MQVNVVVVTYNSRHMVGHLLDSLPAAMGGLSYSVVVVDNSSTDGTREYLAGRSDISFVSSVNRGYAAGINVGVAASPPGNALLALNPDAALLPDCGNLLYRVLQGSGKVCVAVPRLLSPDGTLRRSLRREPTPLRTIGLNWTGLAMFCEAENLDSDYEVAHAVDWAEGSVMMIRRECYEELGGLDESYFLYSEETDFSLRARDKGLLTFYEPAASAVHVGGGSGRNSVTHTYRAVSSVRLYARRHRCPATYVYWAATVLRELRWAITRSDFSVVKALLSPRTRPAELAAGDHLIPR